MIRRRATRRGLTLIAVLLVITLGALVASGMMHATDAQHALVETSIRRTQSRALAWSGVQAAMAEIASQREALLDGEAPDLTASWDLFETPDGRRGSVRLVPVGPAGELVVSEAGKLNVNTAGAETLARIPGIDEAVAERIVERRAEAPIPSVESLIDVEGIDADLMYGRAEDEESALEEESSVAGLVHLLTALSADPNIQIGHGDDGGSYRGDRRININIPWSERLGTAIARRYDEDFAEGVRNLMDSDVDLGSEAEFVSIMRQIGSEPAEWVEVLDVFCATPDPYTLGRVDLLAAPASVLAALPGLDEPTARAIVAAREGLDDESARTRVWPVIEGVMTQDQFEQCVDHVTARSMQWRVRVEVGIARDEERAVVSAHEDGGEGIIGGSYRGAPDERDTSRVLEDRVVLEAVIDVASERPRVAYLRDVTHLDLAFEMDDVLAAMEEDRDGDRLGAGEDPLGFEDPLAEDGAPAPPGDLNGAGETDDPLSVADAEEYDPFDEVGAGLDEDPWADEPAAPDLTQGDEGNARVSPDGRAGTGSGPDAAADDEGVDRRVGRWTVGGGGAP